MPGRRKWPSDPGCRRDPCRHRWRPTPRQKAWTCGSTVPRCRSAAHAQAAAARRSSPARRSRHGQDHHLQRRARPRPLQRASPARPDARPDGRTHRGHRRVVPPAPEGQGGGRRGLPGPGQRHPAQVSAPPKKPNDDAPLGEHHAWREQRRRRQSSRRICVEHTNAEYKQWRPLQRYTGRRETYAETHQAIVGPPASTSRTQSLPRS